MSLRKPQAWATRLMGRLVRSSSAIARSRRISSLSACSETPSSLVAVQAALRQMQLARQGLGRLLLLPAGGQQMAHALYQRLLALIGTHLDRQGALQHAVEGCLIARQRCLQPARFELQAGNWRPKGNAARREQHLVDIGMRGLGKREAGMQQADRFVDQPAGKAVDIAQHRYHAELAHASQRAAFMQGERGNAGLLAELQLQVLRNQAVMAAPASQRQAQMGR